MRATCPTRHTLFDLIILIICGEDYESWSSSLYSFLYPSATYCLLVTNILLNILFSNTSQCLFFILNNTPSSTPIQNNGKITVSLSYARSYKIKRRNEELLFIQNNKKCLIFDDFLLGFDAM
jgi:hypothetical protein